MAEEIKDLRNKTVTFKGFSSKAEKQNFKVYDFECVKQDLINRLSAVSYTHLTLPTKA